MPIGEVCTTDTTDIERWLHGFPQLAPRTLNNWLAAVARLFNFAKGRYLPTAAEALDRVTDDRRGAVEIFQPWELQKVLAHAPERLRPLIALGAFAGLRTIEIHPLDWSAIHRDPSPGYPYGFIEVRGNVAKQHRSAARRIVPLAAEPRRLTRAVAFLHRPTQPIRDRRQPERNHHHAHRADQREQQRHRLPLISRPKNGLRHSYGSYRLPVVSSVDQLALEMGNSAPEIIENYRDLVHPDRVPEYWAVAPVAAAAPEKVVTNL